MAEPTLPVVALVGSETLLGRELREVLADRPLPGKLNLLGIVADDDLLTEDQGEPAVIAPLDHEQLEGTTLALLAGSPASSRKAARLCSELDAPPILIDLTYALEDRPTARLRAPLIEPHGFRVPAGTLPIIAHPAATLLAMLLEPLHRRFPIGHAVVDILEPASERGRQGLDELQQQTVNLLSFRPLTTDFYDAQAAFNLLPRYGPEAMEPLEDIEIRIDRHLATLLDNAGPGHAPMPSLRLAHAPVFHGYSFSLWIEFAEAVAVADLQISLASAGIEIRQGDDQPPSNVGATGQAGLTLGAIERDRNHPRAVWMWAVGDNLRVSAGCAVAVARQLLGLHAA